MQQYQIYDSFFGCHAGGDERPSHNPLFRTILSKWVAHVTIHFDRVSECSVRPFDESSVIYLHCIDPSTEKFTPVTSFACMEICCVLGHLSFPSDFAVRRLCCFFWNDVNKTDRPNTTPMVRAIYTFAVYFSVFRPFCRFTVLFFMKSMSYCVIRRKLELLDRSCQGKF